MAISSFKYKDPNTNTWKSIAAIKGETGATGATGSQGPAGPGVPTGGTQGQVLTKTSAIDYATQWADPTGSGSGAYIGPEAPSDSNIDLWVDTDDSATGGGVPAGGTTGQVLTKTGAADYAAGWVTFGGYSTSETATGENWIDGSPIYRKVIDLGQLTAGTQKSVDTGITGTIQVIRLTGVGLNGTNYFPITYYYDSVTYAWMYVSGDNKVVCKGSLASSKTYAIMEYIKVV